MWRCPAVVAPPPPGLPHLHSGRPHVRRTMGQAAGVSALTDLLAHCAWWPGCCARLLIPVRVCQGHRCKRCTRVLRPTCRGALSVCSGNTTHTSPQPTHQLAPYSTRCACCCFLAAEHTPVARACCLAALVPATARDAGWRAASACIVCASRAAPSPPTVACAAQPSTPWSAGVAGDVVRSGKHDAPLNTQRSP
jgi:hypothetical protein